MNESNRRPMPSVAVIGAGISGLICARTLQDHGFAVTVLDKGRAPCGRTATRRLDGGLAFDHGAQYFTARDESFARYVRAWEHRGVVAEWTGRIVKLRDGEASETSPQPRYVGTPGMSAVAAHLASELSIRREARVDRASRSAGGWTLDVEPGGSTGPFDILVVTVPAPQVPKVLEDHPFAAEAGSIPMAPCWSALVAFEGRYDVPWDGAFVHGSSLSWVARDSSKPGRPGRPECWVLHAGPEWSAEHLEEPSESIAPRLLEALARATGVPTPPTTYLATHRWRYSQGSDPAERRSLFDDENGLVVAGDWLSGGRVEGAFLSGVSAAGRVLRRAGIEDSTPSGQPPDRVDPTELDF